MQHVPHLTVRREAVRIDAEGHRALLRVQVVHDPAEGAPFLHRLLDRLAALRVQRQHLPTRQPVAETGPVIRLRRVPQQAGRPFPLNGVLQAESADGRRRPFHHPLVLQHFPRLAQRLLHLVQHRTDVDRRDPVLTDLEDDLLALHRLADRRAPPVHLARLGVLPQKFNLLTGLADAIRHFRQVGRGLVGFRQGLFRLARRLRQLGQRQRFFLVLQLLQFSLGPGALSLQPCAFQLGAGQFLQPPGQQRFRLGQFGFFLANAPRQGVVRRWRLLRQLPDLFHRRREGQFDLVTLVAPRPGPRHQDQPQDDAHHVRHDIQEGVEAELFRLGWSSAPPVHGFPGSLPIWSECSLARKRLAQILGVVDGLLTAVHRPGGHGGVQRVVGPHAIGPHQETHLDE